jgi:anionic cell wall polymer biosynthesis LytR-Cps2A-Psr (LCP) family protein
MKKVLVICLAVVFLSVFSTGYSFASDEDKSKDAQEQKKQELEEVKEQKKEVMDEFKKEKKEGKEESKEAHDHEGHDHPK